MGRYSVGGRTPTGGGGPPANGVAAALWNPHASLALQVVRAEIYGPVANATPSVRLVRTLTRGSLQLGTVTPDKDVAFDRLADPPSGAKLDFVDSAGLAPTTAAAPLDQATYGTEIGSGVLFDFEDSPVVVPAGTGLGWYCVTAVTIDVAFTWDE